MLLRKETNWRQNLPQVRKHVVSFDLSDARLPRLCRILIVVGGICSIAYTLAWIWIFSGVISFLNNAHR